MAGVLSGIASGLTIAALFRTSFEAFDIFQTSRNQDADYKRLKLRFDIEKCRLYNWGESMGLTDMMEVDQQRSDQDLRFPRAVRNILEDLFRLFQDIERVKDKYGYRQVTGRDRVPDYNQDGVSERPVVLSSSLVDRTTGISQATRIKQNITWVVNDRRKFTVLVSEIKELIDKLKEVTAPDAALSSTDGDAAQKIKNIRDTEALALVAEVCSVDHADIARLRQRRQTPVSWRYTNRNLDNAGSTDATSYPVPKTPRYKMAKL